MQQQSSEKDSDHTKKPQKLTLWQVICSVLAAAFGVQSNKNRERDFRQAKPGTFIIAGLIFTVLFVLAVTLIVKLVLSQASL